MVRKGLTKKVPIKQKLSEEERRKDFWGKSS